MSRPNDLRPTNGKSSVTGWRDRETRVIFSRIYPSARFLRHRAHVAACLAVSLNYGLAWADLLPPPAEPAIKRLERNRNAFDRSDQFCAGKFRGDACAILGSRLAGGGEGVCENEINRAAFTIDLYCKRTGLAVIERGLPEGGFVAEAMLCAGADANADAPRPWNCTPLAEIPADRFCRGKSVGQACTVAMSYDGTPEQHEGICREATQHEGFYYQGRRIATRQVILCMAPEAIERSYRDASWLEKLRQ